MWGVTSTSRVFLCIGATDMRKSFNTLSILISQELGGEPTSGDLFAFSNKRMNLVKILYWHRNGFCLWQKRLEEGRFKWPETEQALREIDHRSLEWLLDGLDINQAHGKMISPYVI